MAKKNDPVFFLVEGSGEFPFDMLRYDEAFPARETDSYPIGCDDRSRSVLLCSKSLENRGPTVGRWNSFCWNVLGPSTDKYDMIRLQESREVGKPVPV